MEAKDNVKRLTNTLVESAACPSGRPNVIVWDDKVKGLGVRINAAGTVRTYLLQYRVKGTRQERQIKIGRHNDPWRIDQARAKAMALKVEMLDGVDPVVRDQQKVEADRAAAVLSEAQTITLRQVMEHYVQHRRTRHGALRAASIRDIERHVTVNLADWADEPVASIKRDACIERFDAISESSPSQAAQCFANLRALLNHARDMFETDDGEYQSLTAQIKATEEELGRAVAVGTHTTLATEIRAHAKSEKSPAQFVGNLIAQGDAQSVSAILGAPAYLSGLTEDMRAALIKQWNAKRNPALTKRLAVLQAVSGKLEHAGASLFGTVERAMGVKYETVKRLRDAQAAASFG